MAFRDSVIAEDRRQKELLEAGKPIPTELKRYARKGGLIMIALGAAGSLLIWSMAGWSGLIGVGGLLFTTFIALAGVAQLVTGRHLLRGK